MIKHWKLMLAALAAGCVAACVLCSAFVFADEPSENSIIAKANKLLSRKKYYEAAGVVRDASEAYPESLDIAELAAKTYGAAQVDEKYIIEAYQRLIRLFGKMKDTDKLDGDRKRLLGKTKKKLEKLMKFRGPIDAAVKRFIGQGTTIFHSLVDGKHYPEACFVYHRLIGAGMDAETRKKLIGKLGADKADLIKQPEYYEDDLCEIPGILKKARLTLKKNKLGLAREECEEALEISPSSAETRSVLYDVEVKAKNIPKTILHGLAYLVTPPYLQDAKTTKEIEKRMRKECPELAEFFKLTKEIADELLKTGKTARSKNKSDYRYAARRVFSLTHRTKGVEKLLSDNSIPKGIKILDTDKYPDTDWKGSFNSPIVMGRIMLYITNPSNSRFTFNGFETNESFELSYRFMVGPSRIGKLNGKKYYPSVMARFWIKKETINKEHFICSMYSSKKRGPHTTFTVRKDGKAKQARFPFKGPIFKPGQWYSVRYKYNYEEDVILVFMNGKKVSCIQINENVRMDPSGLIEIGHQAYDYILYKDIYLSP
jgi:tetratricopeptide (TPR) repeat protein